MNSTRVVHLSNCSFAVSEFAAVTAADGTKANVQALLYLRNGDLVELTDTVQDVQKALKALGVH